MIYQFAIPQITDTKNIKKVFLKKKEVTKENVVELERINNERKRFKENMKILLDPKKAGKFADEIYSEILGYSQSVEGLHAIFENDYDIKKNWKWTPVFTKTKLLKFSKKIFFGKSGEILMAKYCYFTSILKKVQSDIEFLRANFAYVEGEGIGIDVNFSTIKKQDQTVLKLEECAKNVLKVSVDAFLFLEAAYKRSTPQFQTLSFYPEKYIETKAVGMEISLSLIRINTNILNLEYLRRQSKYEMMGGYAKSIVTLATVIDTQLKQHSDYVDNSLIEFVAICGRLFKAVAIWSRLFPITSKISLEQYGAGEDFRKLAGGCMGIVNYISALQHDIMAISKVKQSRYYPLVELYFSQVLLVKSTEVAKVYGLAFNDAVYDDSFFSKMPEKDYITETVGNRLK